MEEIWKDIEGYEGLYQVSNLGRVKSLSREIIRQDGNNYRSRETIMSLQCEKLGYIAVTLQKEGFRKTLKVHRLVALAFIPNPNEKKEVNHVNGIKEDNRVDNLEWCTRSENIQHSFDTGLQIGLKGVNHGCSKLTEEQVRLIKYDLKDIPQRKIAKLFGVTQYPIAAIRSGKTWKHV